MNPIYRHPPKLAGMILSLAAALGFASAVESGTLTLATEPLGTATSSIKPNINQCRPGDPPYNSPDFNTIYYNPAIYYRPALNYDGTEMPNQDAVNTADWTKVRTDEFNVENWDQLVDANQDGFYNTFGPNEPALRAATDVDLATGYPDRVWCTATADAATGGNCRQN